MSDVLQTRIDLKSKKTRFLIYAAVALIISILQILILDTISIAGLTPDLLVILCVVISIREGQFEGIITGFAIGLFFDIVSFDLIGTNALAKTFVGFISGYFYKENFHLATFSSIKFILIVFVSSLVNNFFYYLIYIEPMELNFFSFFTKFGIAMAFYTTVFSIFVLFYNLRKRN